ncbi:hypothetical protein M422DRAFT_241554 [Sphaerobolus stellatus SS14]|nr:hypothetical protein M422DRAFT_241554 [Sphaerobolus stellatus SS14]
MSCQARSARGRLSSGILAVLSFGLKAPNRPPIMKSPLVRLSGILPDFQIQIIYAFNYFTLKLNPNSLLTPAFIPLTLPFNLLLPRPSHDKGCIPAPQAAIPSNTIPIHSQI